MRTGTKSLLFGYHAMWLHPFFVWAAWLRLYGWTWDLRVVLSFFLHDIGYWGTPNMDGLEGKQHPYLGAKIMHFLFDIDGAWWYIFTLAHSRTMVNLYFGKLSRLGMADKLAFILYPAWLIKLVGGWSGENAEYLVKDEETDVLAWIKKAKAYNIETLKKEGIDLEDLHLSSA